MALESLYEQINIEAAVFNWRCFCAGLGHRSKAVGRRECLDVRYAEDGWPLCKVAHV